MRSATEAYGFLQGFQGGFADLVSGKIHFGARDYDPETMRWMEQDPNPAGQYNDGMNLYQMEMGNPVTLLDPSGFAVNIAGGKWDLPQVIDLAHVHSPPAAQRRNLGLPDGVGDLGPHLHGPDGVKFSPRYRVIRDKNGKYGPAPGGFMKSYESQRAKVNRKLAKAGLTGLLLLLSMMANDACGANDDYAERIRKDIQKLQSSAGLIDKDLALVDMVDAVNNMFGSDLGGLMLYNDIDTSNIPSPQDDWKRIGEIEVD